MLQIKNICKTYVTGSLTQQALNDVSFNLRDSEFVAVLGQSGSGKTTLLNIIGGLDRYDSGDIIINNISTKKYSDRDWDSYRNHTIGFVFQSYNLIPHQSILANVELALTISGVSKTERRRRAAEALEKMGLGDQLHKHPNQMSGGQMQRVAIARALVNDPDILLADEPTGALDSETSLQVMELLREVAKDRLVVMVTHNPELADRYANRIIRLHDGKIVSDSNPFQPEEAALAPAEHRNLGKASMSLATALSLSFNNLLTKKARTLLTAFAGSIGIIGIALILSLSTGVNDYIDSIQKDTMTSYPISIDAQSFDLSSMLEAGQQARAKSEVGHALDAVYSNNADLAFASSATASIKENNLTAFKKYLDDPNSEIHQYVGTNGIVYSYDVKFDVYARDPAGELINTDGSGFSADGQNSMMNNMMLDNMPTSSARMLDNFQALLPGTDGALVSAAVTDSYDILYGAWPQNHDEVVLMLDQNNEIASSLLYELGLLPAEEYRSLLKQLENGETLALAEHSWDYAEICKQRFYVVTAGEYYQKTANGLFESLAGDAAAVEKLAENGLPLKIVGVARPAEGASYIPAIGCIGYTQALSDLLIERSNASAVITAQEASPELNVLSGLSFKPKDDAEKTAETIEYLSNLNLSEKAKLASNLLMLSANGAAGAQPSDMGQIGSAYGMGDLSQMGATAQPSEAELAAMLDAWLLNPDEEALLAIYDRSVSPGSYDENMSAFGLVSMDAPASISIYADSFEGKEGISAAIASYNETASSENQISYTDFVGLLMSSVTTIVNVISYVLIAFVAVSLVVSSIMIGIITFISVLERTKEIGILRAIGASKRNISQVFNAETFIVGAISGLLGVGISYLLLLPINAIIHALTDNSAISAVLPMFSAAVLVLLSMGLTLIAGIIPAKKAAKKDPVIALRTE